MKSLSALVGVLLFAISIHAFAFEPLWPCDPFQEGMSENLTIPVELTRNRTLGYTPQSYEDPMRKFRQEQRHQAFLDQVWGARAETQILSREGAITCNEIQGGPAVQR